jgi:hypothetical protein
MLLLCFLFYLWKLTAVGGIPPLVQLLETGSVKAKEVVAFVLRNLCCHSKRYSCLCPEYRSCSSTLTPTRKYRYQSAKKLLQRPLGTLFGKQILVFYISWGFYFWEIIQNKKCMYLRCVAVFFLLHLIETFCMRELLLTVSIYW